MTWCARCNSPRTLEGESFRYSGENDTELLSFHPPIKWWKLLFKTSAKFKHPLTACAECGLVWSEVDVKELADLIAKGCTDDVKERVR